MTEVIDYAAFADEVRAFAEAHCPDDIRAIVRENRKLTREPWSRWHRILHAHGWGAPGWPREYGGTGWDTRQRLIFDEVMADSDCPPLYHHGLRHLGPTLIAFGTEEQKQRFLPGIIDGSDWWCQGYSEPGAGSDLAALGTAAERRGDRYLVTGQKIWTSHAHEADLMYTLVRTSREDRKQKGISLLLIPLASKGVTVRPIRTLDGFHHVNEVFLDAVEVPVENRVGAEGEGWQYGKYLLGLERLAAANTAPLFKLFNKVQGLLGARQGDGRKRDRRDTHLAQMAMIEARLLGLREQGRQAVEAVMQGQSPGLAPSAMKLVASEVIQQLHEIALDVLGPEHAPVFRSAAGSPSDTPEVLWIRNYLLHRATTIYGGSSEVQKNMIARELLGR